jgi:predicted phage tail protein
MFNNIDPQGNPATPIVNQLVNFGWEYVFHCHILSHEEMDMMRPVSVAMPPVKPGNPTRTIAGNRNVITFTDNSIAETAYVLQKSANGFTWTDVATSFSPLADPNTSGGSRSLTDTTSNSSVALLYRVAARNTVGYGAEFPSMTVESFSATIAVNAPAAAPAAPTLLTATLQAGPQARLQWRDNASNEGGFVVERATAVGGPFVRIAVAPARNGTGSNQTYTDTTIATGTPYWYRVAAVNLFGVTPPTLSAYAGPATTAASPAVPAAPSGLSAANGANQGTKRSVVLTWTDNSTNETGFTIQRATNAAFTTGLNTSTVAANATTVTQTGLSKATTYYFRIRANNSVGSSAWVNAIQFPIVTNP